MINSLYQYANHTIIGTIIEGIPTLFISVQTRINRIALDVIVQVAISVPLFYLHHNLFALGFVIGFILDKQIREIVDKVNIVYKAHQNLLERVLFFGGGGFLAILSMPTSIVMATLYYSAQWGASLYQNCLARHAQQAPLLQAPLSHAPLTTAKLVTTSEEEEEPNSETSPSTPTIDQTIQTVTHALNVDVVEVENPHP